MPYTIKSMEFQKKKTHSFTKSQIHDQSAVTPNSYFLNPKFAHPSTPLNPVAPHSPPPVSPSRRTHLLQSSPSRCTHVLQSSPSRRTPLLQSSPSRRTHPTPVIGSLPSLLSHPTPVLPSSLSPLFLLVAPQTTSVLCSSPSSLSPLLVAVAPQSSGMDGFNFQLIFFVYWFAAFENHNFLFVSIRSGWLQFFNSVPFHFLSTANLSKSLMHTVVFGLVLID